VAPPSSQAWVSKGACFGPFMPGEPVGMPSVIFTRPQLTFAGWTETEARRRGHDVTTRLLD
jgi:pyruvate/2-oxoglutarate dehydrogenase complex dihydrolipoamide dehydrogenase (E3) component